MPNHTHDMQEIDFTYIKKETWDKTSSKHSQKWSSTQTLLTQYDFKKVILLYFVLAVLFFIFRVQWVWLSDLPSKRQGAKKEAIAYSTPTTGAKKDGTYSGGALRFSGFTENTAMW